MKIDEAINILKQYIDYDNTDVPDFYTMAEACEVVIKALEQQSTDAVSRQAVIDLVADYDLSMGQVVKGIHALPSVSPQPEVGRWIYDKNIDNWKCSKCGETPKTMGYCGSAAFMAEHFKYCNNCGAKMQEVEDA